MRRFFRSGNVGSPPILLQWKQRHNAGDEGASVDAKGIRAGVIGRPG
jgi:hypothetical protein